MTDGWTATSITANIMRVRLLQPLRRLLLRRPGAASAANCIGEFVISLRNSCTGLRPVHFFQKLASAATGLLLAAAPFVSMPANAAPAATAGMGVGEFYTARSG